MKYISLDQNKIKLFIRRNIMNKDQIKGRVEESKGKTKEIVGNLLNDNDMKAEGNIQKNTGKVQAGFGDVKKDIKDSLDD
jgi:uncharacterized protein YjbJ (UPF0337 family)